MDFPLPQMGEGLYEVELISWAVKPGDAVKRGQALMEVMSDKATMEVPAPFSGKIGELKAQSGEKIRVGQVILSYEPSGAATPAPAEAPAPRKQRATPVEVARSVGNGPSKETAQLIAEAQPTNRLAPAAAPSVRQLARKLGLDITEVTGSGPGGRILMDDLAAFLKAKEPLERPSRPKDAHPEFGKAGTRIKYQGMRRRIGEHLVHSKHTSPHYTYVDECEVTEMVKVRAALREPFAKQGVKLTYLAFFVKAAALALKEVPIVNSSLDEESGEIVMHDRYHIGVAVATASGLIVPVIRDAEKKDLATIAHDIDRLSSDAKSGRPKLEDLRGGTFTVTSVGNIGGLISTPIINHPEVGILGIGKIARQPRYDATGNIYPADLIYLSLSFDHRIVDGAVGAHFGNTLIRHLSNPCLLLLPDKILSD